MSLVSAILKCVVDLVNASSSYRAWFDPEPLTSVVGGCRVGGGRRVCVVGPLFDSDLGRGVGEIGVFGDVLWFGGHKFSLSDPGCFDRLGELLVSCDLGCSGFEVGVSGVVDVGSRFVGGFDACDVICYVIDREN